MVGNARQPGRSTADRLLSVFDAFSQRQPELPLGRIAELTGLPKTTAHRLLGELVDWGALDLLPSGSYRVGIRMWKIGLLADASAGLREIALPHLEDLHRATGENVQLAILENDAALLIEWLHGSDSVPTRARVGARLPLHATAVGKVLAAHAPDVAGRLIATGLRPYTERTIVDPQRLQSALRRVRSRGVAYVFEEMTAGAVSVAVPVRDSTGAVRAAVSVVLHAAGVSPYPLAAALRTAANGIGRQLPQSFR